VDENRTIAGEGQSPTCDVQGLAVPVNTEQARARGHPQQRSCVPPHAQGAVDDPARLRGDSFRPYQRWDQEFHDPLAFHRHVDVVIARHRHQPSPFS
jgi:hypothetical protein